MTFRTLVCAVLALAGGLLGCAPGDMARSYCDARMPMAPQVDVATQLEPPVISNLKTRSEISRDLNHSGKAVLDGQAMGATAAGFEQKTSISAGKVIRGLGYMCTQPKVSITLTVAAPVIDIAREFVPGSCRYAQVLEHELRHADAYGDHLELSKRVIRNAILDHYWADRYYFTGSEDELDALVTSDAQNWLVPLISKQLAQSRRAQQVIDSPSEYLRLTRACPDEPLPESLATTPE